LKGRGFKPRRKSFGMNMILAAEGNLSRTKEFFRNLFQPCRYSPIISRALAPEAAFFRIAIGPAC